MLAPRTTALAALVVASLAGGCLDGVHSALDIPAEIVRAGPIALETPGHGARVLASAATFSWTIEGNTSAWSARLLLDGLPVDACPSQPARVSCVVDLEPGRAYRWTVEAVGTEGALALSNERSVRANAPPGAPRARAGDEGSTQVPLEQAFSWQAARDPEGDAVTYRVEVRNASGEVVACAAVKETTCRTRWPARAGETLAYTVRARDAVGADGPPLTVHVTMRRPVVFLHGWTGDETTWAIMEPEFTREGFHVLDFDLSRPGLQLMTFAPTAAGETIEEMSRATVLPGIRRALVENGFAADARVDIVAHSMGGLVTRHLVEREGEGGQIATLTMVGTPNRGSPMSGPWLCRSAPDAWRASCEQMEAGSPFLDALGHAPRPTDTTYATVGGGRDSVAPDASVRLDGVPHTTVRNGCHSGTECSIAVGEQDVVPLTGSREVRDAILRHLAPRSGAP